MPFTAIAAGAGAGGNILGAWLQSRAASKAAKQIMEKGNLVGQSIDKATQQAIDAGYRGIAEANSAMDTGLENANATVDTGVSGANQNIDTGVNQATGVQQGVYDQALQFLAPYLAAGGQGISTLADLLKSGGEFNHAYGMADYQQDPGYEFRLAEGQKALERSAAARGGLQSGGTLKALTRYAQGVASDEYQRAFDRYQADRAARFGMLSGLAGFGQQATGQAINAGENYANQVGGYNMQGAGLKSANTMHGAETKSGNIMNTAGTKANIGLSGNQWIGNIGLHGAEAAGNAYMGAANAGAAGLIGSGNAWAGGLSNAGNSLMDLYAMYKILQKKQADEGPND